MPFGIPFTTVCIDGLRLRNATETKTTLALCSVRAGGAHHSNSLHGSARTQTSSKSLISAALHHASARESSHYNIFKLQQQKTETDFNQNP